MHQRRLVNVFHNHLLHHKTECSYRLISGLTQSDFITKTCVYLYFSARARAKALRNLSIETWASGVKSLGNIAARTTRMLWDRIYEKHRKQIRLPWLYESTRESELTKDEFRCTYLEIGGVNTQLESVKLAEVQEPRGKVLDFADSLSNAAHHGLPVLPHWGRAGAQVFPVREIGFGLGVDHQHPRQRHSELNGRYMLEESIMT